MKSRFYYFRRWLVWAISRLFSFIYLRPLFGLIVENKDIRIPRRPFIMVSNHGTFFDPWLIGHLSKYPLSIMMNEEGFRAGRFSKWYLRWVGAYPKKKGASDIKAMKYTLQTLKAGFPVLIFPEGQTTWDGETQPIVAGIEGIIKRAGLPLVMMNVSGNFISKPWWSENQRRGHVWIRRKLITPAQLETMSKAEIRDEVIGWLRNNDLTDERCLGTRFKGAPSTEGLTRFVWICPACNKEDALATDSDGIRCTACEARWTMDNLFRFTPATSTTPPVGNLHDWSGWHKKQVQSRIDNAAPDQLLTRSENVRRCTVTDLGDYPTLARGTLSLTREKLTFEPEDGAPLEIPVVEIGDYVFQRKTIFEFRRKDEVFKFDFESGSPMKWVFYFRYLNNYAECEQRGYI